MGPLQPRNIASAVACVLLWWFGRYRSLCWQAEQYCCCVDGCDDDGGRQLYRAPACLNQKVTEAAATALQTSTTAMSNGNVHYGRR
ncbi:hypothetical protein COO60DRAFT_1483008 [Scenedesmus sp. NREL 46B-D3]|nr:hypothetical protein COO60DRAFT_1483008 [Scenedesmus sp. NREL 46B-D3]